MDELENAVENLKCLCLKEELLSLCVYVHSAVLLNFLSACILVNHRLIGIDFCLDYFDSKEFSNPSKCKTTRVNTLIHTSQENGKYKH